MTQQSSAGEREVKEALRTTLLKYHLTTRTSNFSSRPPGTFGSTPCCRSCQVIRLSRASELDSRHRPYLKSLTKSFKATNRRAARPR